MKPEAAAKPCEPRVLEYVACDGCGSEDVRPFLTAPRNAGYFTDGELFTYVKCSRCGLVYLYPRPSRDVIHIYYDPENYYAFQADGKQVDHKAREQDWAGGRKPTHRREGWTAFRQKLRAFNGSVNRWYKERLNVRHFGYPAAEGAAAPAFVKAFEDVFLFVAYLRLRILSKDLKIIPWRGQGRLLDVGCGAGQGLAALRAQGWQVKGLEPSKRAAEEARQVHKIDVSHGTLEDRLFEAGSFDVVTFGNSFEHVHSPSAALKETHRILAPGGLVLIKLPNIESWEAKIFGARWFELSPPLHLFQFSARTLTAILKRAGFRVLRVTYDAGANYGIRESIRWRRLANGKSDFKNRKIFDRVFSCLTGAACLFRRGGQLVVYAEKA